jgi:mannose-6-phosphate isomerase-like protein (cupin superfamily)
MMVRFTLCCVFALGMASHATAQGGAAAGAPPPTSAGPARPVASGPVLPATDIPATDVQKFLKALPTDVISDLPIRVVDVGGSRVGVYGVFRAKDMPGDAIAHLTRTTEIYYIVKGAGTLVTGGVIAALKPPPAGRNAGPRGDRIDGGVSRRVSVGDIIIIPGRTPHWWSSLESDINYLIYRADPDGRMNLK